MAHQLIITSPDHLIISPTEGAPRSSAAKAGEATLVIFEPTGGSSALAPPEAVEANLFAPHPPAFAALLRDKIIQRFLIQEIIQRFLIQRFKDCILLLLKSGDP